MKRMRLDHILFKIFGVQSINGLTNVLEKGDVKLETINHHFEEEDVTDLSSEMYGISGSITKGIVGGKFVDGKKFKLGEILSYGCVCPGFYGELNRPEICIKFEEKINRIKVKYIK